MEALVDAFFKLSTILSCASIISHIVVKLTISRNNILKNKPLYVYIISVLFNNTLVLLWIVNIRTNLYYYYRDHAILYVLTQIFMVLQGGNLLTLIALTLQYPVRRANYIRFIIGIWILVIVFSIIFTITYFAFDFFIFSSFTVRLLLLIEFPILLVVHAVCRVLYRKERGDYALQLNFVSTYICCHALYQFLYQFMWFILPMYYFHVSHVLAYVEVHVSVYGVVNAITLLFFDRKYKICFLETIKCSKTKYFGTHENEIPDETLLTTHNPS